MSISLTYVEATIDSTAGAIGTTYAAAPLERNEMTTGEASVPERISRADRGRARGRADEARDHAGVDGLRWRARPHGADRPAFNSRAGRCCRSTPAACAA